MRDTSYSDAYIKATFVIIHGLSENSDLFLESAIQYALNGFDVHLIDLRGFGLSAGVRMAQNKISDYHHEISALLKEVNPVLPLFIYGHSMGGLSIATYLTNNPNLNIAGVVMSAPLLEFHDSFGMDSKKRFLVKLLQPHIEVSYLFIYIINRKLLLTHAYQLILYAETKKYSSVS